MFIVFFGSTILKDSPLNAVQMLWVNLIMDTLGALALATEPPSDEILNRMPYKKNNPIVTKMMWRNVFGHAIYQITVLIVMIFYAPGWLCENYQDQCLKYSDTNQLECEEWNPWYATNLYENEASLAWWASKDLKKDDFNQDALNRMICQHYKEGLDKNNQADFVCTS